MRNPTRRGHDSGSPAVLLWLFLSVLGLGGLLFTGIVAFVQWLYLITKPFYVKPDPWIVPVFIGSAIVLASSLVALVLLQFRANQPRSSR